MASKKAHIMDTHKHWSCRDFPERCCRLVLLGKSGSGKSATGNTILGLNVFKETVGINAGTVHGAVHIVKRNNIHIQVMDTPGLSDPDEEDDVIIERINEMMFAMHPGPHALLLVLRCSTRFTQEDLDVYLTLKHIFGKDLASHTIIIFTGKDELPDAGTLETQIQDKKNIFLQKVLDDVSKRYLLFSNKALEMEKEIQFRNLMREVKDVVNRNGGPFTHTFAVNIEGPLQLMTMQEIKDRGVTNAAITSPSSRESNPLENLKPPQHPKKSTQEHSKTLEHKKPATQNTQTMTIPEKKTETVVETELDCGDPDIVELGKRNKVKSLIDFFNPKRSDQPKLVAQKETCVPVITAESNALTLGVAHSACRVEHLSIDDENNTTTQPSDTVHVTHSCVKNNTAPNEVLEPETEPEKVTDVSVEEQLTALINESFKFEDLDDADDSIADEWRESVRYYAEMVLKTRIINNPEALSEIQRELFSSILPGFREQMMNGLSQRSAKAHDLCVLM